jgi:CelD/BcsL family acetyltransferase involved in cellulose biosynthesis
MPRDLPAGAAGLLGAADATGATDATGAAGTTGAACRVATVDTRTSPLWAALVACRPSDVFHAPAWHQVLHDTYGFEVRGRVLVDDEGAPIAGWASCRIEDLRGVRVIGLPFSDYGDPLVDDAEQWAALTAGLDPDAPVRTRCLHTSVPVADPAFSTVGRARWHGIDLRGGEAALWAHVDPGSRRAIRRATGAGVAVRATADARDVRAFFELHLGVRKRKYGMLAQPYRFFEAIRERFLAVGHGTLLLAEVDGVPVAGVLLLRWRDRTYYKFNASSADDLAVRPNDLLMWHAIRYGIAQGCSLLDLGLSDWDQEGLLRYKRKYATREGTIAFLERPACIAPASATPPIGALLPALTALFTASEAPDALTERAGDLLYRYFA